MSLQRGDLDRILAPKQNAAILAVPEVAGVVAKKMIPLQIQPPLLEEVASKRPRMLWTRR